MRFEMQLGSGIDGRVGYGGGGGTSMIDLLPCPFCGGEARLTVHEGYHRASCFTCGNGTRAYADRHEAVRRWSRRHESGTFQNGNDHGTTEEASGVGTISEKETVGEGIK